MIFIVSKDINLPGINEDVYEICLFDYRNLYIRKWVYEKINNGEYHFVITGGEVMIMDRQGKQVPKLTSSVY